MPPKYRRTQKLILPEVQLRLVFTFLGTTLFCLIFQFLVFAAAVSSLGMEMTTDQGVFFEGFGTVLWNVAVASIGVILPLAFLAGVLVTHRIAGPLYRFTQFLNAVQRGEHPGECRIRKGDMLHGFCDLLNSTTAPLRKAPETGADAADPATRRAA